MVPASDRAARRRLGGAEAGFTIIEVLISALMLAFIAAAAATAFIGSAHASGYERLRADAQALAQQDENRLRGLTIDQLSNLSQTLAPVTLDGTQFTVKENGQYVSDVTGTPSCTNPSADYLQTTSTVSWANMGIHPPVVVTGLQTPPVGSTNPTHGTLAVSVINAAGSGSSGMNVSINNGATSISQPTANGGCTLFGDLPQGTYSVSIAPPLGTYVDGQTGQPVTPTSPDVASPAPTVVPGAKAASPTQFQLDTGGSATFSFGVTGWPTGVAPNPAPTTTPKTITPAVVLFNTGMKSPGFRVCSPADASGCPVVGSPDASFGAAAWNQSTYTVPATPLFPYTYSAYAGTCANDEPKLNGGTDGSVTVTSGGTPGAVLNLPPMVVRLYNGTPSAGTEIKTLPANSHLTITDTGCGLEYVGTTGTLPTTMPTGQATLPLTTTAGSGVNDIGYLKYPGMPYGSYQVCYDTGGTTSKTLAAPISVTNSGSGEFVQVNVQNATTLGKC